MKLRYDLIPPEALEALAYVYTAGAEKYGPRDWERGVAYSHMYAALMRHLERWRMGEDYDPDDGQHHLASVVWRAMALLTYELRGRRELDDLRVGRPTIPYCVEPHATKGGDDEEAVPQKRTL